MLNPRSFFLEIQSTKVCIGLSCVQNSGQLFARHRLSAGRSAGLSAGFVQALNAALSAVAQGGLASRLKQPTHNNSIQSVICNYVAQMKKQPYIATMLHT
jgi:hypothetical protein